MIFQQYRGHLLVVWQPDHGVQTGLFARHWGNEQTPPFTPREPVIAAGTRHDDGWKGWEARLLPDQPYGTAEAFLAEMAKAAVTILECRASRD